MPNTYPGCVKGGDLIVLVLASEKTGTDIGEHRSPNTKGAIVAYGRRQRLPNNADIIRVVDGR